MYGNHLLDALTREGVLISLNIRFWRATKKLQAQDLGLDPDDVTRRLISLGHKKLLPREALGAFALIESRAHALVTENTFPFLNGLARFLPNPQLASVQQRLERLHREFEAEKTRFRERYATLREEALSEWREAARRLSRDPARIMAGIEDAYPAANRLDGYFLFAVNLFQVRAPERLEAQLIEAGDQQAIIAAREHAARQANERIEAGVDTFVRDCVADLREQTATLCDEMLESMRTGKTGVHQRTLNRLIGFIDHFKSLNFAGDRELEARLEEVRRQFLNRDAESYRDDARARRRLNRGIANLADAARELAREDTQDIVERFGQMGVRRLNLSDMAA